MAVKSRKYAPSDAYFKLLKEFPLTSIRNDEHLADARKVLNHLVMTDLDEGAQEYFDALTDLVEVYEDKHVEIPDAPTAGVLRMLMETNGLTQNKLAKAIGMPQSSISEILAGSRNLNVRQMSKLAEHFSVAPAVFLPRKRKQVRPPCA